MLLCSPIGSHFRLRMALMLPVFNTGVSVVSLIVVWIICRLQCLFTLSVVKVFLYFLSDFKVNLRLLPNWEFRADLSQSPKARIIYFAEMLCGNWAESVGVGGEHTRKQRIDFLALRDYSRLKRRHSVSFNCTVRELRTEGEKKMTGCQVGGPESQADIFFVPSFVSTPHK
ncbi:hypothetical protein VTO42DRAFT_7794 [Malbranchea cinnamomea]